MEAGTDPAVLAMISTLFVIMIGNVWHQSRENSKTRDLIVSTNNETRNLIVSTNNETRTELRGEIKELDNHVRTLSIEVAKLSGQFAEFKFATEKHQRTTEKNHEELRDGLGDNRERLARIEGRLSDN